ncbi:TOX3 protein, partial [Polyodon spathula]|nr:TOX3 protein [Polyodon spathula]
MDVRFYPAAAATAISGEPPNLDFSQCLGYYNYNKLTATTPVLTWERRRRTQAVLRNVFHQPVTSFHSAGLPCSQPRATASEDNAALGSLQPSPQVPGQGALVRGEPRTPWLTRALKQVY